ncbi:GGDEF domain-containing protein [Paracoccus limosus]
MTKDQITLALDALLPMHLQLCPGGQIRSVGPTLARMLGGARDFDRCFIVDRPTGEGRAGVVARVLQGGRVFLRLRDAPAITLRGHGVALGDGLLMNLGFGIALVEAVRHFSLTDADFAPADLAMEFLFIYEANRAVMGELARANRRLEEAREAAEALALTDPLTGLLNRRGFEAALEVAARNAAAVPFALGQIDLDRFKDVNDQHGHAAGDEVLQHVAQILRGATRATDRVARTGGDEFLLLLTGSTRAGDLENLGRRIIHRIESPIETADALCQISASIGFSQSRDYPTLDTARMLADADAALYAVKESGRGAVRLASQLRGGGVGQ